MELINRYYSPDEAITLMSALTANMKLLGQLASIIHNGTHPSAAWRVDEPGGGWVHVMQFDVKKDDPGSVFTDNAIYCDCVLEANEEHFFKGYQIVVFHGLQMGDWPAAEYQERMNTVGATWFLPVIGGQIVAVVPGMVTITAPRRSKLVSDGEVAAETLAEPYKTLVAKIAEDWSEPTSGLLPEIRGEGVDLVRDFPANGTNAPPIRDHLGREIMSYTIQRPWLEFDGIQIAIRSDRPHLGKSVISRAIHQALIGLGYRDVVHQSEDFPSNNFHGKFDDPDNVARALDESDALYQREPQRRGIALRDVQIVIDDLPNRDSEHEVITSLFYKNGERIGYGTGPHWDRQPGETIAGDDVPERSPEKTQAKLDDLRGIKKPEVDPEDPDPLQGLGSRIMGSTGRW